MRRYFCLHCNAPFEARRTTAKFCSPVCRLRHHRRQAPPDPSRWLAKAAEELRREVFEPAAVPLDVSRLCFTLGRREPGRRSVVGGYLPGKTPGTGMIYIDPYLGADDVLAALLHELVHHVLGEKCLKQPHRGDFPKLARRLGLLPPWTATPSSEALERKLKDVAGRIGAPPWSQVTYLKYNRRTWRYEPPWVPPRRKG